MGLRADCEISHLTNNYTFTLMNTFVFWIAEKTLEIALGKLIGKLLIDSNIKQVKIFLKLQILLVCLDWVLLKTPLEPQKLAQLDEQPTSLFR